MRARRIEKFMVSVTVVIALSALAYSACAAVPQSAELVLDRKEILVCAPLSGYFEFVYAQDVYLQDQLSYIHNSFVLTITKPNADVVVVDKSLLSGGLSGLGSGRISQPGMVSAGHVNRVPVFVLKEAGENFVFDSPGTYLVEFALRDLDPPAVAMVSLEVIDCGGCDVGLYRSKLPRGPALMPFGNDSLPDISSVGVEGPYRDAILRYSAYNHGGSLVGGIMRSPLFSLEFCISESTAATIDQGQEIATECGCNLGMWEALASRHAALVDGIDDKNTPRIDTSGVRWFGP